MLPLTRTPISSCTDSFYGPSGACLAIVLMTAVVLGCGVQRHPNKPSIEVTAIPDADIGGRPVLQTITGRVTRAGPGDQIALYARSGDWYVQLWIDQPFTKIQTDPTWGADVADGT